MSKTFNIVQIGYGVLGKAYTQAFTAKGNSVHILEANQSFVDENKGKLDIYHISEDLSHLKNVDFITIMVNTPLDKEGRLNMNYLYSTLPNVAVVLKNNPDCLVLIRSTVQPMFTKKFTAKLKELLPGQQVQVAFQPEFLRAVSSTQDAMNPWLVVLGSTGLDQKYKDRFYDLYAQYVSRDKITELSVEEAELHKIAHNCFNAAKISFFNHFQLLCEAVSKKHGVKINANAMNKIVAQTAEGVLNPRYGTTSGHAYYGTCLPKDSSELRGLEAEYELPAQLFKAVVDVNDIFVSTDKEEVLDGDNHMAFSTLAEVQPAAKKVKLN